MCVRERLTNIKLSLARLQMYYLTVPRLQNFLGIATQMEQYFRSLVANIATGECLSLCYLAFTPVAAPHSAQDVSRNNLTCQKKILYIII